MYYIIIFFFSCFPLVAQQTPPSTFEFQKGSYMALCYIDILSWDEYVRELKIGDSLSYEALQIELKKKKYTPITLQDTQKAHLFCVQHSHFVNDCKKKGTTDNPYCSFNDMYKKLKEADPHDEYNILYRFPTKNEYLLLLSLLETNKKLRKKYVFSDMPEALHEGGFITISSKNLSFVYVEKASDFTFRLFAEYVKNN